nr:MAG TPA: hypothetical protein [Caudoviricetes sp.]
MASFLFELLVQQLLPFIDPPLFNCVYIVTNLRVTYN